MKNKVLLGAFFITTIANAQIGKVGINTSMPTESLDIKGTAKIQELPKNGEGKIYNGTDTKNTTFTATRTVVADNNGVIGYIDGVGRNSVVSIANIGSAKGRYVQSGSWTDNSRASINDSEIKLNIPEDNSTAAINWVVSFARTTQSGTILQKSTIGAQSNARSYIMRISVVITKDGKSYSTREVAEEYFFQDAVPAGFSKTIPVKYVEKLNKGNYTFSLNAYLEQHNSPGTQQYFTNTRVIGEGTIYK